MRLRRLQPRHALALAALAAGAAELPARVFDPGADLLSLHYDHAPDKDDGHSAAADRTIVQTLYGCDWVAERVVAVSGAYGKNASRFRPESDAVMDAVWNDCGAWLGAHDDREGAVAALAARWGAVLEAGGAVWVKEGGQSDLTAEVVRRIRGRSPGIDTARRIRVVQHADWNERQSDGDALDYVRAHTDYIRIKNANRHLNRRGGDPAFEAAARDHPVFGAAWTAAFDYYDPTHRIDFSDTGELLHILGFGEMGIDAFRKRFLEPRNARTRRSEAGPRIRR